jgi:hypothetical protein
MIKSVFIDREREQIGKSAPNKKTIERGGGEKT